MLRFVPGRAPDAPLDLLCVGAHSDDIEIGCGGTLLRLLGERPGSRVWWVVFSANDEREVEARSSATALIGHLAQLDISVHRFRESYFPTVADEIKDVFEDLKSSVAPDVVFTHRSDDIHQDHRTLGQLTWNTFRDHAILAYEIPKYEGDLGQPNLYVPLDGGTADRKVDHLMTAFGSQRSKRWFRSETFRGLMALRAIECNADDGWAEAFHAHKIVV